MFEAMAAVYGALGKGAARDALIRYIGDGGEIYRISFAIIRAGSRSRALHAEEERVAVRIIHACGMVEIGRATSFLARRGTRPASRRCRRAHQSCATPDGRRMA